MHPHGILFATVALLAAVLGVTGQECHQDADCVPATCCAATACLPASQAEQCSKVTCQLPCKPFTVDCGGVCACSPQKRCTAVLNAVDAGKCTSKMKKRGECWW